MTDLDSLSRLEELAKKATPDNWGPYSANLPFYAIVHKPRPSFSKHDQDRPDYWRIEDATYIAAANPSVILELIAEIKNLREAVGDRLTEDQSYCQEFTGIVILKEKLEQLRTSAIELAEYYKQIPTDLGEDEVNGYAARAFLKKWQLL